MKKLILISALFFSLELFGQCYSFSIQITSESCPGCCDGSLTVIGLSGGCPPYSIMWLPGPIFGPTASGLCSGMYNLIIQDSGCCGDTTAYACLDCPTGFDMNLNLNKTDIEAGVDNNMLGVKNLKQGEVIELFDIKGQKKISREASNTFEQIDLSSLDKQIYILVVRSKQKNVLFQKKIIW